MEVGVLVLDGMRSFDVVSTLEVFSRNASGEPPSHLRVATVGDAETVQLDHGLSIGEVRPLAELADCTVVLVPGFGEHPERAKGCLATIASTLHAVHARGGTVASLCTGAFLLAETGLLDGRRATTHWQLCDRLQQQYPRVRVEHNVLHTQDGQVWTSAGVSAGIDLCLALIEQDQGRAVATDVARSMVLPGNRRGGQAQFVPPFYSAADAGRTIADLHVIIRLRLAHPWSVDEIAHAAHLSVRALQRHFRKELNCSPVQWLTRERVDAARELLEQTQLSIEQIAHRVGFSQSDSLRKHFRSIMTTSPTDYREMFQARTAVTTPVAQSARPGATRAPSR